MEPSVYRKGSRTCIVLEQLESTVIAIPLNGEGLEVKSFDRKDFTDWFDMEYDIRQAAQMYLNFSKLHGITTEALLELTKILRKGECPVNERKVYSDGSQSIINVSPMESGNINFVGIVKGRVEVLGLTQKEFAGFKELEDSAKDFAKKFIKFAEAEEATPQALRLLQEIVKGKPINYEETNMSKKSAATATKKTVSKKVASPEKAAPEKVAAPKKTAVEKAVPGKSLMAGNGKSAAKTKPSKENGEAKNGKAPKEGIGFLIRSLLVKGTPTADIVAKVLEKFPEARTNAANVSWYRGKMKASGELA